MTSVPLEANRYFVHIVCGHYCVYAVKDDKVYVFICCRPINNILGFSRETLVAVTIEEREWYRPNTTGSPEPVHLMMWNAFFSML